MGGTRGHMWSPVLGNCNPRKKSSKRTGQGKRRMAGEYGVTVCEEGIMCIGNRRTNKMIHKTLSRWGCHFHADGAKTKSNPNLLLNNLVGVCQLKEPVISRTGHDFLDVRPQIKEFFSLIAWMI